MNDFAQSVAAALTLIGEADAELLGIVALSVRVSLTAGIVALLIGAPIGALLAITRFRGRQVVIVLTNALLGLPPVVVGLALYLLLSRSGPLGAAGLLFTPTAMVIAQTLLATPIVVALVHRPASLLWAEYGDLARIDGLSTLRSIGLLFALGRTSLLTAFLAAFGRAIAEVGAIIIVGGNIRGFTRTMTTAIALETSKGELPLALGLGLILLALSVAVSTVAFLLVGRVGEDSCSPPTL
ncbi:ABC transporter permease [Bradyrhizobium japonicum]